MIDLGLLRKHVRYLIERKKREYPSPHKAKKMLDDDSAHGHQLTDKQKKFFRALAHGWKPGK